MPHRKLRFSVRLTVIVLIVDHLIFDSVHRLLLPLKLATWATVEFVSMPSGSLLSTSNDAIRRSPPNPKCSSSSQICMTNTAFHIDDIARSSGIVEYKVASTRGEREAAFRLVYNSYLRAGLGKRNPHQLRVTPYHLLPTTDVFIALCHDEVIATVTLVADSEFGLPMESVYKTEIERRREQGLKLGEISCLADRRRDFRRTLPIFTGLCRLMIQAARQRGMHETLVAVHPKHARFYERFCAFDQIGQQVVYEAVQNHPAVAMSLNFSQLDRQGHENYEKFFAQPYPTEQLDPRPISEPDREFFQPMIDPSFRITPLPPATLGTLPITPALPDFSDSRSA